MLNLLICGSGGSTFHHEEDQGDPWNNSPCTSPTKARKNRCHNKNKNPYSSRGLDKFSALLNDLEEKRNKIYSQVDSRDIFMVRFVYSNSNDCVPIVVKSKTNKEGKTKSRDGKEEEAIAPFEISDVDSIEVKQPEVISEPKEKRKKKRVVWNMKLDKWRRPSYYLPAIIILILLLLTMFGRTFAILCTCLGWYIVPTLKESSKTERSSTKKKDHVRKLSEKKMVIKENKKDYMRSISGVVEGNSAPHHSHQKSW
ncbi:hypothetical protein I3843_08G051000 [Carya illinoinensis]|uniref:ZCF37 n=1 Tax=Carya illinoinensis TaxID=32201 RepID=A0A8T1PSV0_CARIL|nr:uncharacterized protein LOC122318147 [Carya illinoinensis]KAG6644357.1 hypothetical protein CIPAW_08G050400 [Carya illinoinensis]KAG6699054.1 hypothetical protein I3842_08G051100 [Carya illinoinensis]KAG7966429.1 hypothetical protein I3843_08G051000 [Carya illinoinensis]